MCGYIMLIDVRLFSAGAEAAVDDMPPLEGDEADDASKMEEVD